MLLPVIMAGGSGSRLWPLSRQLNPKQFLPLVGETSLLQQTLARLEGLGAEKPLILCNEEHRFLVAEQLRLAGVGGARVVLEPEGRNTAPAIALAALYARQSGTDPLLLVLAADHYIEAPERFRASVQEALPLAEAGSLVTFGIVPQAPETGYGYLQRGEPLPAGGHRVARFVEKPGRSQAEQYLQYGGFFWNSGMFVFRASRYLEELGRFEPEMLAACEAAMATAQADLDFVRVNAEAFAACPEGSIDFSVMEKTDAAAMVALDAGWNDIGSWSALWAVRAKDPAGNVAEGDVLLESASNNHERIHVHPRWPGPLARKPRAHTPGTHRSAVRLLPGGRRYRASPGPLRPAMIPASQDTKVSPHRSEIFLLLSPQHPGTMTT